MSIVTKVINIKYEAKPPLTTSEYPGTTVYQYIGRGSKWGNPFVIGKDGDRIQVLEKYDEYIRNEPELLEALGELRGKTLGCFCRPAACHGMTLLKLICEKFGDLRWDNFTAKGEEQDVS